MERRGGVADACACRPAAQLPACLVWCVGTRAGAHCRGADTRAPPPRPAADLHIGAALCVRADVAAVRAPPGPGPALLPLLNLQGMVWPGAGARPGLAHYASLSTAAGLEVPTGPATNRCHAAARVHAKVHSLEQASFKAIIAAYKKQPQARPDTFKSGAGARCMLGLLLPPPPLLLRLLAAIAWLTRPSACCLHPPTCCLAPHCSEPDAA